MHRIIYYSARIEYLSSKDNPLTKGHLMRSLLKSWEECEEWLKAQSETFNVMDMRVIRKIARKAIYTKSNSFKLIKEEYRYYD